MPSARQSPAPTGHRPRMGEAEVELIRTWHECVHEQIAEAARSTRRLDYLGLDLLVPAGVVATITPVSHLLGERVLAETRPGMRVLDLGTGCGSNAVLAATRGADVLATDLNPAAVHAATANAARNDVAGRVHGVVADGLAGIEGRFDLVVLDPPLRWFAPRDLLEAASTDQDYRFLRGVLNGVGRLLTPTGRVLVFFGDVGDVAFLRELLDQVGLDAEVVALGRMFREGRGVDYVVHRAFPVLQPPT
ncbi:MAG: methyltransferase [Kineosporiaceae bacterium]